MPEALEIVDCLFDPWMAPAEVDQPPTAQATPVAVDGPARSTAKSLRCQASAGELLPAMDRAGVRQALVTQCKRWWCERQWMCIDTRSDDVLRLVRAAPSRFAGLAGYNPFAIGESVRELEEAAASGGFRGVYLNAENFGLALTDNRVYPLYAKADELGWPVMVQFGINRTTLPPHPTTFADLLHVAGDFPELTLVAALRWWPSRAMLEQFAAQAENTYFAVPAALLDETRMAAEVLAGPAAERLVWGSEGRRWEGAVEQLDKLPVAASALRGFAGETARRVFGLGQTAAIAAVAGEAMAAER